MPDIDKIRKDLADTAHYHGQSYAAIVGVAAEIEAVEDKTERTALRREFRELHALTSQVWARVAKRFEQYTHYPAQRIRAAAYCCQLDWGACMALYESHEDHLDESGVLHLILRDVNDALDARRNGNGHAKTATLAEECANLVVEWQEQMNHKGFFGTDPHPGELAALPAVASVLARRAKAEGAK